MELPIFIYKLMCQISLWISISYVLCEYNIVGSWNKSNTIIKLRSSFQICQLEILVLYSSSTNVNVNMSFQNSNFEGNFSTYVFGNSLRHYRELEIDCWAWRHILCEKDINIFICVEFRIVVGTWYIFEAHIFPRSLLQTYSLETNSLCLNTRLLVSKIF